ncbi:MAG: AbrB/MazE/SpoVT family DNA-binding domain-containing protein [Vulcanisaeta sp.]|jgi:bifunctional DNA-binding transcriptional regulator/antitoxin component of YhaV-PrlF toxin-antitoxin module|uniref:AbrB/MazE/SpoVT family DNA-binding domain-containing protein n=1 Tax=Vulcanisaeta sp. TaxID=2020871 RepID=UPI003D0F709C
MPRAKAVGGLPFRTRVYINNQIFIPANVIKALGLEGVNYADVVIKHGSKIIRIAGVKLLSNGRGFSRQFTIPKQVRERYGIMPLDEIEVVEIKPSISALAKNHGE